jgi:anti-anti-sigma factor
MEIERKQQTDGVEVRISGRLDAHWSDQLDRELAEVVRGGARRIDLDMEAIDYLSSAGIRVLMKSWKELKAIKGTFRIVSPSANVRNVLKMSGMLALFEQRQETPIKPGHKPPMSEALLEGGGRLTIYHPAPEARLRLRLVGRPERLAGASFTAADVTELTLPRDTMAVGLGAFGADFAESRSRFGEFLALGGVAVALPTDASGTPDDQVALEAFVPKVQALYAVLARGEFAHFFHFEPDGPDGQPLPLSRLVESALPLCGAAAVGFVLIAESDGLVGAQLRRPPVEADVASPFAFPGVRDWFALTTERAYQRTLVLVAGIALKGDNPQLAPYLRPLGGGTGISGHFHAAALSYRALPGGLLDLPKTAADLMESQSLLGVLHLLNDTRDISGIGESLFIRGAVWTGPLDLQPQPLTPGGAS